jgi:hypothetical protein
MLPLVINNLMANQIFYSLMKNAYFLVFETLARGLMGQNISRLPTRPENDFEADQSCFNFTLGKVF